MSLGLWNDEGALTAGKLCVVGGSELPRDVDEGLRGAMVHQESTGSGGREAGQVIGGSWKAGGEEESGEAAQALERMETRKSRELAKRLRPRD
jgi:hypothetical protein